MKLTPAQKKFLKSKAHHLDPLVMVGKNGITAALILKTDKVLDDHELVKIRFLEFKKQKKELTRELSEKTKSHIAGLIGHIAILYRPQSDPEKRKIIFP